MEVPLRLYRVVAACLRRLHCVCIECYRFHCVLTETVRSCHCDHCAPAALLLRPSTFAVRWHGDPIALWAKPTKLYKSSLIIATLIMCSASSWLLNASKPGYSWPIVRSSRSRTMQTLCISFRDEGVGGLQGEGDFGYGNGWMSTGDFSMVTIIGLCVNSGMKTLPVTLISSVCHPTFSTSFWTGWVH